MNAHLYVTNILTPFVYLSVYESIYAHFSETQCISSANYSMCCLDSWW